VPEPLAQLGWSARVPLRWRIFAVNIFALALLAGGLFYLDAYRSRLVEGERTVLARDAAFLSFVISNNINEPAVDALLLDFGRIGQARVRLYNANGSVQFDSFLTGPRTYELRDPSSQAWQRHAARLIDRTIDAVVGAPVPEPFVEPQIDRASYWHEIAQARARNGAVTAVRLAPDRTPVLIAAHPLAQNGSLLITSNPRRITSTVRAERLDWLLVLAATLVLSMLLSRFLARTIAEPLRKLAKAALLVRLGRERDVIVPRLEDRRDEIGQLARAVSDMASALRERIDAGEQFAADVTHELKNPLASLRSALETFDRVDDPALKGQLMEIASADVQRLDRLVTDIAEAARLDAQLTRTQFTPVDIGELVETIVAAHKLRDRGGQPDIAFARPRTGTAIVEGVPSQLMRVFENLIDNALSFSPSRGVVRMSATCAGNDVLFRIEDDGPGIAEDQREAIFRRFHSLRPETQEFGKHSGLGLAIARTIVEAHDGTIKAANREHELNGACFEVRLPSSRQC
jgi:two-component system, OmpR family, sensor histidine kinase ChvG